MSYSLTIMGDKPTTTPEEAQQFEQEIAAKAKQFAVALEGVKVATAAFGHIGQINLLEEQ